MNVRTTKFSEKIRKARFNLTDKILYFPCLTSRPKVEYISHYIHINEGKKNPIIIISKEGCIEMNMIKSLLDFYDLDIPPLDIWNNKKCRYFIKEKARRCMSRDARR